MKRLKAVPPVVEECRLLINQKAWATWRKLPPAVKAWIGPDDLIEDGMRFACCRAFPRWEVRRGAKFITYLWYTLDNFYQCRYIDHFYADIRCDAIKVRDEHNGVKLAGNKVVSIQAVEERAKKQGMDFDFERIFEIRPMQVDFLVPCHAVDSFVKLYNESSDELKDALLRWFLRPVGTKFQVTGRRFLENSREFRELAFTYRLEINDCRHLVRSVECLDKISRELLHIPYNLDEPTPGIRPRIFGVQRTFAS